MTGYLTTFYLEDRRNRAELESSLEKERLLFIFFWTKETFGYFVVAKCLCLDLRSDVFMEWPFCFVHNHGASSPDVHMKLFIFNRKTD